MPHVALPRRRRPPIFVGEVVAFDSFGRAPLVFDGGNYGLLMKKKVGDGEDTSSSFGDDWLGFLPCKQPGGPLPL